MTELNNTTFEQAIKSETPVLVDFWASWCPPCRALAPVLEQIENERGNKGEILKLNIDDYPDIAGKYSVASIPTLILFKNGEELDRMVGGRPKDDIVNLIDSNKQVLNAYIARYTQKPVQICTGFLRIYAFCRIFTTLFHSSKLAVIKPTNFIGFVCVFRVSYMI